jgi:hypothetical protein
MVYTIEKMQNFKLCGFATFLFLIVGMSFSCSSPFFEDKIPPSTPSDLTVKRVDFFGFEVEFTATGDDLRTGRAERIELRYSQDERFALEPEKNFESLGIEYPEVPKPPSSGKKVSIFVKNLNPKTRYFVAVRLWDEAGNSSFVSNVVEVTTLDVPGTSGKFIGHIQLENILFSLASDGENLFVMFPGFYKFRELGGEGGVVLDLISDSVPPLSGAQLIYDGEKFIAIGGIAGGVSADIPIFIRKDGSFGMLTSEGNLMPFGSNGFFGFGVLKHKVVRINNSFAVLGGIKLYSRNFDYAIKNGRFARIEMTKIPIFKVDGQKLIWDVVTPSGTVSPLSVVDPSSFSFDQNSAVLWGGNLSDDFIIPSNSIYLLKVLEDNTFRWEKFSFYSGVLWSVMNSCEAESYVKIIRVKPAEEYSAELTDIESLDLEKVSLSEGEKFLFGGRPVIVESEEVMKRVFVVGRFRFGNTAFSGVFAFLVDKNGRAILSKLTPVIASSGQQFIFPQFELPVSCAFVGKKLFILYSKDIYIFEFKNYEIVLLSG